MNRFFHSIQSAAHDFMDDDCLSSAAAMAYYSIFSLPPLLVLVMQLAHYSGISEEQIRSFTQRQLAIAAADSIARNDSDSESKDEPTATSGAWGYLSHVIGGALLLFSATGLFAQLQVALNRAWEVQADPEKGGYLRIALKRVFSLGMVVVVALLLMISLVITTLIDEIIGYVQGASPSPFMVVVGIVLNNLVTLAVATLLFAAVFKVLPDAKMAWRDTWPGAFATALMFIIGKAVIGWYLQRNDFSSTWGASAASALGVLVWIYYSTTILLFGAELTEAWATTYGHGIAPAEGAVRAVKETRREPSPREHESFGGMKPA